MEVLLFTPDGIRAIFFDLDGTIRHNLPSGGEFFADYVSRLGLHIHEEDRRRAFRWEHFYWANSLDLKADRQRFPEENRDFWLHYSHRRLIALGVSPAQAEHLAAQVFQYMEEAYHPASVIPEGVLPLLQDLRNAGYILAVISNREKPFQQELDSLGLSPYMDFALAGGEVQAWKPEPDIFMHACQRADVQPGQSIYVGDNYFADVVGARSAGLQPVLYDPQGIFPEAGCPVLTSFDQLPLILEKV